MKDEVLYPPSKSGKGKSDNLWLTFLPYILYPLLVFWLSFVLMGGIASASTLTEIQRRGYLVIAVKDNLCPLGFRDDQGNLQGLEIDLAKQLAADLLGKADRVKFQPVTNRDRLRIVFDHKADLAIAQVTATESRSRLVSFSVPYYFDGAAVVTKNPSIQKFKDLTNRKIAVLNHSSNIDQVKYFIPEAKLIGVNSYAEARSRLESNTVDAVAADASILAGWVQTYPQYQLIPYKLSATPLAVVMAKGLQYDEFRRKVNEAIARYTVTGWLKKSIQKWELP